MSRQGVFRDSLKHLRQVHLYSNTPGHTVWAQSRQTNRPSLWAIIGLNSMPAMQYGQRMIKVVSVSIGIGRSCTGAKQRWTPDSTPQSGDPLSDKRIAGSCSC